MLHPIQVRNLMIGEGRPKVCVPLVGATPEEIRAELGEIASGSLLRHDNRVDLVEFRADYFNALDNLEGLAEILREVRAGIGERPLIFTVRSEREGGNRLSCEGPSYYDINRFVIKEGLADLVDLELFSEDREEIKKLLSEAHEAGLRVLMSSHDFDNTPETEEMENRLKEMEAMGADVAKLAVMPKTRTDVARLMEMTTRLTERELHIPVVTMAMGELGAVSRITGQVTGSAITFASLKKSSAPGQLPVAELNEALDMMEEMLTIPYVLSRFTP